MIKGFIAFNRGLLKMPLWIQLWVGLLVVLNMIVPLFFLGQIEARIIVGVFLVAGMLMFALTGIFGFKRILGLGHFVWFPLLAYLIPRLGAIGVSERFGLYLRLLVLTNAVSLLMDVADVIRYARGERGELPTH